MAVLFSFVPGVQIFPLLLYDIPENLQQIMDILWDLHISIGDYIATLTAGRGSLYMLHI